MTIINEIKSNMNDLEDYPKFKEIIPPYYIFPADRKNAYLTITSNVCWLLFRFSKLTKIIFRLYCRNNKIDNVQCKL